MLTKTLDEGLHAEENGGTQSGRERERGGGRLVNRYSAETHSPPPKTLSRRSFSPALPLYLALVGYTPLLMDP
ncbi:hypothetical protein EVAR_93026_1 [Eumeta japonica]|uniref:Uncharacterized protein n=1 Tax=Eumeta variegata TaxID=151549 RepID=A0A4C2AD40_EUMVA|nr:hypothetical protein EVAR_93026_1 [Eumeta japonica]